MESTRTSRIVNECQLCQSKELKSVLFVGYLPPVNTMPEVNTKPNEQSAYPANFLKCEECGLFQLGLTVDAKILFPPSYPYTSGTTKILRDNFAELYREVTKLYPIKKEDFVVDIGSNDGTLLGNFYEAGHPVLGIEPTNAGLLAQKKNIRTIIRFFNDASVDEALKLNGKAKLVTAANCFAHIDDVHSVVKGVLKLLKDDGLFVTESHYVLPLIETVQYDTVYHEHLRYYSLEALENLFARHGLEIVHVKEIPTHGGSIRVYAARKGAYPVQASVALQKQKEVKGLTAEALTQFKRRVVQSKMELYSLLKDIKAKGKTIYGIGAPSRASTLINYVGLDDGILDCVLEVPGSYKIGKYIPGTLIPVQEESRLYQNPPDYALLLSWHIADELIPKIRAKGFKGGFIVPLPQPRVVEANYESHHLSSGPRLAHA